MSLQIISKINKFFTDWQPPSPPASNILKIFKKIQSSPSENVLDWAFISGGFSPLSSTLQISQNSAATTMVFSDRQFAGVLCRAMRTSDGALSQEGRGLDAREFGGATSCLLPPRTRRRMPAELERNNLVSAHPQPPRLIGPIEGNLYPVQQVPGGQLDRLPAVEDRLGDRGRQTGQR